MNDLPLNYSAKLCGLKIVSRPHAIVQRLIAATKSVERTLADYAILINYLLQVFLSQISLNGQLQAIIRSLWSF